MVSRIIEDAGSIPVSLYVLKVNPARAFYEKLGFGRTRRDSRRLCLSPLVMTHVSRQAPVLMISDGQRKTLNDRGLRVRLGPVVEADFGRLADLRVVVMRDSLERVGRFHPERSRERLRSTFIPEYTRFILFEEVTVGFYAARPFPEGRHLDHLYVHPEFQSSGIGGVVLRKIFDEADRDAAPILVGTLKESASNRFYLRHGFVKTGESEWDIYCIRPPGNNGKEADPAPSDRGAS